MLGAEISDALCLVAENADIGPVFGGRLSRQDKLAMAARGAGGNGLHLRKGMIRCGDWDHRRRACADDRELRRTAMQPAADAG